MTSKLICIECPQGCGMEVWLEGGKVVSVSGNTCPRGDKYARSEMENPVRTFTSSVLAEGLDIKMLPVRTSGPIPKDKLFAAMAEVKKIVVSKPVQAGDAVAENFMGLGVNLTACRPAKPA
ncbi:MAG: DUF1667 domain-containing protein [Elusimicrobiales bacterium]